MATTFGMKIDKTINYYNENAESFYHNTIDINMEHFYQKFLEHIPNKGKILDVGCGSGRDSLYFINNGYDVTSIDASEEMVKMSSSLTGQSTIHLRIEDINYKNKFNGIWACASLLHIEKKLTEKVLISLGNALKKSGVLYASYKYGTNTNILEDRYYNNFDESSFGLVIGNIKNLDIINQWTTVDLRPSRENEKWLNVLLEKNE